MLNRPESTPTDTEDRAVTSDRAMDSARTSPSAPGVNATVTDSVLTVTVNDRSHAATRYGPEAVATKVACSYKPVDGTNTKSFTRTRTAFTDATGQDVGSVRRSEAKSTGSSMTT